MAVITIQCLLQATEETLRYLWNLMIEQNTLLVSEILERIRTHPELDKWIAQGYIPVTAINEIAQQLKQQPKYDEMPGRFNTSAETLVKEIYKSWFAIQRKKTKQLWDKKRWLKLLKSEQELLEATNLSLSQLQAEAQKIRKREEKKYDKLKHNENSETEVPKDLFDHFFNIYDEITTNYEKEKKPHLKTKKLIQQCVVVYLLKNQLEFANQPEDPEKYQRYRRKKEIYIERLKEQLKARLPRGRNLNTRAWNQALEESNRFIYIDDDYPNNLPLNFWLMSKLENLAIIIYLFERFGIKNHHAELLQARLLRRENPIPFPVSYNTNTDIYWSKDERGRICVTFNGMKKDGHVFEIYSHSRQLHWFQRFYEDYKLYKQNNNQIPAGLITLRSARLVWKQREGGESQKPWLTNNLYLHCSVETELWTKEGTEEIRQQKILKTQQKIDKWLEKESLTKNQQQSLKSKLTSLRLLKTFQGFNRPSKYQPQQNSSLAMGVCIGLKEPVTVAVVNLVHGNVIACQDTKQLLDKPIKQKTKRAVQPRADEKRLHPYECLSSNGDKTSNGGKGRRTKTGKKVKKHTRYKLFLRRRQQQQDNDAKRQQAQTKFADNRFGESELGKYVDRLLAKAIVEVAIQYKVSSIVLPDLDNVREILDSEIQARAEAKIPGVKKAQKQYARNYRKTIHRWSYARLCDAIASKATQKGIAIEIERQIPHGTPQIQARDLALMAYHHRQQAIS